MQFLTRKDFYLQRIYLELQIKEIMLKLYENYFISNYDFLDELEVLQNLKDSKVIHLMVSESGEIKIDKGVLEEHKEDEFCCLYLEYLQIEEEINKYDALYKSTFKDRLKKRIFLKENVNIKVENIISNWYATSYYNQIGKGFEEVADIGLLGTFVVCGGVKEFDGCPVWEERGSFLIPYRNLKNKEDYKIFKGNVNFKEVTALTNISVSNVLLNEKIRGYAKGVFPEPFEISEIWGMVR